MQMESLEEEKVGGDINNDNETLIFTRQVNSGLLKLEKNQENLLRASIKQIVL